MIIDTHAHYQEAGYPALSPDFIDAGTMVSAMDRHGIDQCWISSIVGLIKDYREHNRLMYENVIRPYPARFVGYAVFNPNYPQELEEEAKRCFLEYGFGAVKIHNWLQGFAAQSSATYRIIETAIRYNKPVMFHDGTPPYADTCQIAQLAERYPEAIIILGHAGMYDSYRDAIRTVNLHENLYLTLLGPTTADAAQIIQKTRSDRILFGTDYCCAGAGEFGESIIRDRLEILDLACPDPILKETITWDNAKRIIP